MIPKVRVRTFVATSIAAVFACSPISLGKTRYVDVENCPGPGAGTPDAPFCTIGEAIAAAESGDLIILKDDIYTGPGNRDLGFGGKLLTIQGENGPTACIIDCEGTEVDPHRAFVIAEDDSVLIRGLTIVNGYAPDGRGGAILAEATSPTITDCVFENNQAVAPALPGINGLGGAIHLSGAGNPLIERCAFRDNSATATDITEQDGSGFGGAIFVGTASETVIRDCAFVDNAVFSGGRTLTGNGGAVRNLGGLLQIQDSLFLRNEANRVGSGGGGGGAIATRNSFDNPPVGGDLSLDGCLFIDNVSGNVGGAISGIPTGAAVSISRCHFIRNFGPTTGGVLWLQNGRVRVVNSVFAGNSSAGAAVALIIQYNLGQGAEFVNCLVMGNETTSEACSGIGFVGVQDKELRIRNCTLRANRSGFEGRGALANSDLLAGQGVAGTLAVVNSIVYQNSPVQITGDAGAVTTVASSCIQYGDGEPWYDESCMDDDPQFVAQPGGQFTAAADYDEQAGQTTFTDVNAGWEPGELAGLFLNPDTSQYLQSQIVSNTETQLTVWGDFEDDVPNDAPYQINDYHLSLTSPAVDTADNGLLPPDDLDLDQDGDVTEPISMELDGLARILCGQVDLGATELGAGDYDCNGVVDFLDFAEWPGCMNGFEGTYAAGCESFDMAYDENVNLADFAGMQLLWSTDD
ncbi:MAG: right-handed parallel beta-helix repeat-containing protein [Planctomycetota bacterium]|jgi:hypothetical protein